MQNFAAAVDDLRAENAALRREIASLRYGLADLVETQSLTQNMPKCGGDAAAWYMAAHYSRSYLHVSHCPADICELVKQRIIRPVLVSRDGYGTYTAFSDGKISCLSLSIAGAPANISCEGCPVYYEGTTRGDGIVSRSILDVLKNTEYKTEMRHIGNRNFTTKAHMIAADRNGNGYNIKIAHKKQCNQYSPLWHNCFEGKTAYGIECDSNENFAFALLECVRERQLTIFDINRAVSPADITIRGSDGAATGSNNATFGSVSAFAIGAEYIARSLDNCRLTLTRESAIVLSDRNLYSVDIRDRSVSLLSDLVNASYSQIIATDDNIITCIRHDTICLRDIRSGFGVVKEYANQTNSYNWQIAELHFCPLRTRKLKMLMRNMII